MAHMPTYFAILDSRGALEVSGPDAVEFLHGQTSCDLRQLSAERSLTGVCCTPQGRAVFDFRALAPGPERVLLVMQAALCDAAAQTLGKYIVFSKAEAANVTADWVQVGCWGDEAEALAGLAGGDGASGAREGSIWVRCGDNRYEALAPAERAQPLLDALGRCAAQRDEAAWREQEIRAGLGHIEAATSGRLLPQELNYQATGHIDFTKGCYTGQEIVARLHYKGKTKRPMHLASYPGDAAPTAGADIVETDGGRAVGTVINGVASEGRVWLLASFGGDAPVAVAGEAQALEVLPLPYGL